MDPGSVAPDGVDGRTAAEPGNEGTLLQSAKGLIGWIAASLAGLTAIVYAAGYFLFHAHLNMLGLGGVVSLPPDQMLVEGGRFFFTCLTQLIRFGLAGGLALAVLFLVVAALREVPAVATTAAGLKARTDRLRGGVAARHPGLEGTLLLVLIVGLLTLHADRYYYPLYSLQGVSELLYSQPGAPLKTAHDCDAFLRTNPALDEIARRIVTSGSGAACRGVLAYEFDTVLEEYLVLLIGSAVAFHLTAKPSGRFVPQLIRFLISAYALMFTAMLPVAFGVLVRVPRYPVAEVALKDGTQLSANLIDRGDGGITLWDGKFRHTSWSPTDAIKSIHVTGEGNLFD